MTPQRIENELHGLLAEHPAVALPGPRQAEKKTLALEAAKTADSVYLDLESYVNRAKVADPELYLAGHEDRMVVMDEVHHAPDQLRSLRGMTDSGRRRERRSGRFLHHLGSASMDLLRQSGESLAGRIIYLELGPIDALEVGRGDMDRLWTRGGFPDSYLADGVRNEESRREAHLVRKPKSDRLRRFTDSPMKSSVSLRSRTIWSETLAASSMIQFGT